MLDDTTFMERCLQLARNGAGHVAPNPMVGAVLVSDGRVLAEGWHRAFGGPHAEVECLRAFGDAALPDEAAMYVNLEPCSHHGRTPPCVDLLIARGMRKLVVGCGDPDPRVSGRGIARARGAGIEVITGVLAEECRWLNRRFIHSMERKWPYIILKWARSIDGFMDRYPRGERGVQRISSEATDALVHRWRAEEQAIMVGSHTVINDDPSLTVRHVLGRNPLRVVMDRNGSVPETSRIFDGSAPTLVVSSAGRKVTGADVLVIGDRDPLDALMDELNKRSILSILVEGGAELLTHFLSRGMWNEARVITGATTFERGTPAPQIDVASVRSFSSGVDRIDLFTNDQQVGTTWDW